MFYADVDQVLSDIINIHDNSMLQSCEYWDPANDLELPTSL